jgi:sodium transport system permease protein
MRSAFATVFAKEIVDNARDKRSLSTALLSPLMGPLALVLMFFALSDAKEKARSPEIAVVGREHAPTLVGWLEQHNVVVKPAPTDPDKAVRDADFDVALVVPAAFGEQWRAGDPAVIELIVDDSRQSAAATVGRITGLLTAYGAEVGALRLLARGVDPVVTSPISIQSRDVGTARSKTAMLLAAMPIFLIMACFVGGTYVAIDATAGERERGSIEALLLNPISATSVVLGKVAATAVYGWIGVVISAAGFALAVALIPFASLGLDFVLPPLTALLVAVVLIPVVVLASALQIAVGVASRTFKTAQSAISLVMLLPTLPGAALTLFPQQPSIGLMLVPTVGHDVLMMRLIRGESIDPLHVVAATLSVLVVAAVCVAVAVKLYGPRLVVGR